MFLFFTFHDLNDKIKFKAHLDLLSLPDLKKNGSFIC